MKVAYLQNMLECPVCGGSYTWKSVFVEHCRSEHHLQDLAAHLDSTFPDDSPAPSGRSLPRQLFESFADILQADSAAEDAVTSEISGKYLLCWWRSTVVERRSLTGELSLSCARPAADG